MPHRLTQAQSVYLDVLRALAAWAVLFGHSAMILQQYMWLEAVNLASMAVLVFFLLSGFLISQSVFQKWDDPKNNFGSYFIDRFCRIFCAYLPALGFILVMDTLTLSHQLANDVTVSAHLREWMAGLADRTSTITFLGNLVMLQDYPFFQVIAKLGLSQGSWYIRPLGSAGPLWTVAIEWWIYLVFGLAAYVGFKKQKVALWAWVLGAIALPVAAYNLIAGYNNCLSLIWILGLLVSLMYWRQPQPLATFSASKRKLIWLFLGLASTGLAVLRLVAVRIDTGAFNVGELQFALYLGIALFAFFYLAGQWQTVPHWLHRAATFMAGYSFSLYLVHNSVLIYLQQAYREYHLDPRLFWAGIIVSNLIAIVFWALFERHYRGLARWLKSRYAAAT